MRAMERARKTHLEGYDPYVVALRISELEAEAEKQRLELSPVYRCVRQGRVARGFENA